MARHEVCLEADLSLLDAQAETVPGQENTFQLYGKTRDLSEAGVLLVVPLIPIDEKYCREESRTLPLTLYLPNGQVNMEVAPVRCRLVDEREPARGFLMGAEITGIDEAGRTRLREYLRSISARENPETTH